MPDKQKLLDNMYAKLEDALVENGVYSRLIRGEGQFYSRMAFIGEAPGGEEEKMGRPFVGSAGKNLAAFLEALSVGREDVYLTNVVKWRTTKLSPKSGKSINRTPTKSEIELCAPFLFEELKIIEPKLIVTLGNVALKAVACDSGIKIGDFHGRKLSLSTLTIFPLYHPASVIYNRELNEVFENDLENLRRLI